MDYHILSIETSVTGKKIRISFGLIVVIVVIIATLSGIQFASYVNKRNFAKSLIKNVENLQAIQDQTPEETIQEPVRMMPYTPRIPVLTEENIQKFRNIYNSEEKIAYLTFDDGPSKTVTPLILDILKENRVPATFFVLGTRVNLNPDIVKRAYEEGHYIANHGYSHVYKDIYSSKETVLDDYNSATIAISKALGIEEYNSYIYRFPGGSMGSGKYSNVKNEAKPFLLENGIMYLDWNCLTGDAEGKHTKEALLEHLYYTSEEKNVIVVLMHDASDKILTAESLQDVINMLSDKGFEFKNLYNVME